MAFDMMEKLDKYWKVVHGIMAVAVILDPRFRMRLILFYFPEIYGSNAANEIEKVRNFLYELVEEYQSNTNSCASNQFGMSSSTSQTVANNGPEDRLSKFDKWNQSYANNTNDSKNELDFYLEEDILPRTQDFDILSWWKTNGLKYPTLQKIARDILAILMSSVASESAFSTSGRILSPYRSRLHPNTLEALICTQNWIKPKMQVYERISNDDNNIIVIIIIIIIIKYLKFKTFL
ncbi:hypothetical protein UlMin_005791 [Ulmus minor]